MANILYLSHGGGPLPLLGDTGHAQMVDTLQRIAGEIAPPSAILVISAHWRKWKRLGDHIAAFEKFLSEF